MWNKPIVSLLALAALVCTACLSGPSAPPTARLVPQPTNTPAAGATATSQPPAGAPATDTAVPQGTALSQLVATATAFLGSTAVSGLAGTAAAGLEATALSVLQGTATPRTVVPTPVSPRPTLGTAIIARNETDLTFGIIMLSSVPLQAGHAYQLQVRSRTGKVAFSGSWIISGRTAAGPAVDTGLLDDSTDVAYDILPPPGVIGEWTVTVTLQNKGSGNLSAAIVEVQPG